MRATAPEAGRAFARRRPQMPRDRTNDGLVVAPRHRVRVAVARVIRPAVVRVRPE